jgi:hypothetical protein
MTISAVSIAEPNRPTCVAVASRPLPPPPRWDARPSGLDRYDIVYDQAGGALFRLLRLDGSGHRASPSAAYPFQSFHSPRFVRGSASAPDAGVAAILDKKAAVVFSSGMAASGAVTVAPAQAAVTGKEGEADWWLVAMTAVSVPRSFGGLPGLLSLLRFSGLGGAPMSITSFPGVIVAEFDAVAIDGDVAVFATGHSALLLLETNRRSPWSSRRTNGTCCQRCRGQRCRRAPSICAWRPSPTPGL